MHVRVGVRAPPHSRGSILSKPPHHLTHTPGFIAFVLTLQKGYYSYQFKQFGWTHMILLTVFVPSSFFVSNIFEGLIWFLLPTSLVIINDIFAYLAGAYVRACCFQGNGGGGGGLLFKLAGADVNKMSSTAL